MNQIISFENTQIRTHQDPRTLETWWAATDICQILGIKNSRQAVSKLADDEKLTITSNVITNDIRTPNRGLQFVSESGLYLLIFLSRKPEAVAFRRWVTGQVLPEIRRKGYYGHPKPAHERFIEAADYLVSLGWLPYNAQKMLIKYFKFLPEEDPDIDDKALLKCLIHQGSDPVSASKTVGKFNHKALVHARQQAIDSLRITE